MPTRATPKQTDGWLRQARKDSGLSLNEVARRAKVDPAHLSRVERGQREISVAALARVAKVIGLEDLQSTLVRLSA